MDEEELPRSLLPECNLGFLEPPKDFKVDPEFEALFASPSLLADLPQDNKLLDTFFSDSFETMSSKKFHLEYTNAKGERVREEPRLAISTDGQEKSLIIGDNLCLARVPYDTSDEILWKKAKERAMQPLGEIVH